MPPSRSPKSADDSAIIPAEVIVSDELRAPVSTGIELCYQTYGDAAADPLLLVMGLGGPMTWWDEDFCKLLASKGFFVIRYDNRDTGRSGSGTGRVTRKMLVRAFTGTLRNVPYSIGDLADDAFGLLDHLGIDQAHIAGISMGGMIVQTMAIARPERVASVVSIMSTTGRRTVGWQHPQLLPALLAPRQKDRASYIETSAQFWQVIGSPAYPLDVERGREKAGVTWDRGINGAGVLRHMAAVLTQPNRTHALAGLRMPAAVVHGTADKMVHVSGGRATASAIHGAELLIIDGMGHDLPPALFTTLADVIRRTANRA